jgi:hypothetical protein
VPSAQCPSSCLRGLEADTPFSAYQLAILTSVNRSILILIGEGPPIYDLEISSVAPTFLPVPNILRSTKNIARNNH